MLINVHMHQNSAMYEKKQLNKTEGTSNDDVIQPTPPFEEAATHESAYTRSKCCPEKVWPWNWNCDNNVWFLEFMISQANIAHQQV